MNDSPMNEIPATATPSGLSHAARLVHDASVEIMRIRHHVGKAHKDRVAHTDLWNVARQLDQASTVLTQNGADMAEGEPYLATQILNPWELDTPEARELLDLLTRAQAAAEKVDAQRGNTLPAHIPTNEMESRGTDFADWLSHLRIRLHCEIVPPQGGD